MGPAAWSILARAGGGAPIGPLEGPGNTETPHPGVPGGASRQQFVRRRPTLPHRSQCSTIGAEGLSFRVRNGAGRFPFAMTAVTPGRHRFHVFPENGLQPIAVSIVLWFCFPTVSREPHSGRVASLYQVIGLLVPVSFTHCCASTSGLSTQWSSWEPLTLTGMETSS